jgi:hypothetical protein
VEVIGSRAQKGFELFGTYFQKIFNNANPAAPV